MWKTVRIIVAIFLGAAGPICAQTDSRAAAIEADRTSKEANLTPQEPSRGEAKLEAIQNSVPFKLMTGELDGFGIGFGAIVPGVIFGVGPRYSRTDLLGGRLTMRINTLAAMNQSYLGGLDLSMPNLAGRRGFIEFSLMHRDISEMPYFGPGPDSRKTGRSDYRLEDTNIELRPGVRIVKGLRASLIGSYLAENVGPGHSTRYISTEQQFGPQAAPGIDRQTNFLRGGGMVEYDWRDRASNPTSGGKYFAQYVRYLARDLGAYSFLRLDLDASQYIPLFNQTRVIALHGATSLTTTGANQSVPFYLQPTLGGPDNLRGYRVNRFYGDNSTLLNAEYRWEASPLLQMVVFADGGKVFNRWEQWNFHSIQTDVGFGLRFKSPTRVVMSFDTAFSHEGFQIWFRMNNAPTRAQ